MGWGVCLLLYPIVLASTDAQLPLSKDISEPIIDFQARLLALENSHAEARADWESEKASLHAQIAALESVAQSPHDGSARGTKQMTGQDIEEARRRLGSTQKATIKYNSAGLILDASVRIRGSLNVTGIVSDATPVVEESSTQVIGFTAVFSSPDAFQTSNAQYQTLTAWRNPTTNTYIYNSIYPHFYTGDTGILGDFDASTGKYTAPVRGVYNCAVTIYPACGDGDYFDIMFKIDGSECNEIAASCGENSGMMFMQGLFTLDVGTTVEVMWNSWSVFYLNSGHFTCYMLAPTCLPQDGNNLDICQ